MDFTMKQWIIGAILIVIVVIIVDGIRRMRNARRDSLHMSLKVKGGTELDVDDVNYGSEFPNGGARPSQRTIDKERIDQVKNKYDFGRDLSDPTRTDNALKSPLVAEEVNTDQWVDNDEYDEEYYAEKWDDEPSHTLGNDDLSDEKFDDVTLGDGNLDDDYVDNDTVGSDMESATNEAFIPNEISEGKSRPVGTQKTHVEKKVEEYTEQTKSQTQTTPIEKLPAYQQPEQVPLNLEESVPVLMESVIEEKRDNERQNTVLHEPVSTFGSTSEENIDFEGAPEPENSSENSTPTTNHKKERQTAKIRSVGKSVKPNTDVSVDEEAALDTHSANKPRYESKYFSKKSSAAPEKTHAATIQEVLVVNVKATQHNLFHGSDLLQQVLDNGLRYGAMEVFHRHADEDGEGPIIFSMANMLKPGTFDLKTIDSFSTAGVTFFLTLPVFDDKNMAAFDLMIATAKNLAENLDGELNDENRSIMTGQTVEHYRERIRDFSRRQQLEKKR
jgi:cell division protein ZipA